MLGSLRVVEDDHPVDLGGPRQRRLLAALVLADGMPVSVDRLVDCVFGSDASPSSADTLRSYVTRLRRALSSSGQDVVVRDGYGYRLVLGVLSVDEQRFAGWVAAARRAFDRGDHADAAGTLRNALALWRGNAYDDLADETWVAPEARRLDESRRVAQELLAEALTAGGRSPDAVDVLRDVLAGDPYREGAVSRLMMALYRAGRPADALAAYREFAARVADDLGIDPGPDLQRLHEQVLERDPLLDATAPAPTVRGYELRERLGRGRQGAVYAARMPGVNRDYAIRVYDAEFADSPTALATFDADVRLLVTMDEPTLVPVYDGWREPGSATLVMRRMSGTLADELARGPLAPERARDVLHRTGRALVALHRRGRRHGRVEPSSVLMDEAGQAYLAEPVLGEPSVTDADAVRVDSEGFLRLAQVCLPDQPSAWWDGLDPARGDMVATVTEVLSRFEAPSLRPENPYVGLRPFEAADADRYFGREHVVADLVERVRSNSVVMLVGGSGSGKSSIVRAGLVPRLRRLDPPWTTTVMVPGSRPMQHLAEALQRVQTADVDPAGGAGRSLGSAGISLATAAHRASGRLLLVVDQMEELFTVAEPDERERFLAVLAQCANGLAGDVHVVATIRADYFDHPLDHPVFGGIAAQAAVAVPPMGATDLERTVVGPAAGRLEVDEGLVTELVSAVNGEPGALPALQFTLRELADRGHDALRRDDLAALGGVDGAIAHRAEQMYAALDPSGQQVLRQVLQRMVVVDETGEPSRRTVPRAELAALGPGADELVEEWVASRLLVTGRRPDTREPTVTLAHEAVLTRWPRLREWVDENRERLLAMARLTQAAQEWDDLGRDPAALPRGGRLEQAEHVTRAMVAPAVVQDLLAAAQALRADEQRQAAEAAAAEQATSRRLRRQRWMLAVALVAAIAVGWYAIDQRGAALAAAEEQRRRADAGASSLVAASNEAGLSDWSRALLLAVEAHRVSPSRDTDRNLMATLVQPRPVPTTVWTSEDSLQEVVVDPGSDQAAVVRPGGAVDILDIGEGRRVGGLQAQGTAAVDLRDGILVVADSAAGSWRVRVAEGTRAGTVMRLPAGVVPTDLSFSPDVDRLAVADTSGTVTLLTTGSSTGASTADGSRAASEEWTVVGTLTGTGGGPVQQVAWSGDGSMLYGFDAASTFIEWDVGDTSPVAIDEPAVRPSRARVTSGVVDRDSLSDVERDPARGNDLSVVDMVAVEDTVLPSAVVLVVPSGQSPFWVNLDDLSFTYLLGAAWDGATLGGAVAPDGTHYAVDGSSLVTVSLSARQPYDPRDLTATWDAVDVDTRADGSPVTVGSDGNVTTWTLPGAVPGLQPADALDGALGVSVSPDGTTLVRWDSTSVTIHDGRTLEKTADLDLTVPGAAVLGAAVLPGEGTVVVHVCPTAPVRSREPCDSVVSAHDVDGATTAGPLAAGPALVAAGGSLAVAPGLVATADLTGQVVLRDPATLAPVRTVRSPEAAATHGKVELSTSPDGGLLMLSTERPSSVTLWRSDGPSDEPLLRDDLDAGAFVSDETVLVAEDSGVAVWGTDPLEQQAAFPFVFARGDLFASEVVRRDAVADPAFSAAPLLANPSRTADGSVMVTGEPGQLWLWDPAAPAVVAGPLPFDAWKFDPSGERAFVWRGDGQAFVMSLEADDLVASACDAAGRALTESEWARFLGAGAPYAPTCSG